MKVCSALGCASDCWLARQMQHLEWLGLTHHDTIFPLFIFIAGVAFPFSYAKQRENGSSTARILWKVFRRLVALVLLGMVYECFFGAAARPFRFGSVLARIGIAAAALAIAGCGIAWGFGKYSFPFSKVLWSPSFTLVVGAYSVAAFAAFYWLIDVRGVWKRTLFFRVIGLNAITIYLAQPLLNLSSLNTNLFGRVAGCFSPVWSAVFLGATYMLVCWSFLYVLYRKNVFLKV